MRICLVWVSVLSVMLSGGARACVGARPLAMGGAFVAVADDVQATYWNPAGLVQLTPGHAQSTIMHTATNRDAINYQDYVALAARISPGSASRYGRRRSSPAGAFAFGVSYILSKRYFEDTMNGQVIEDDEHWMWISAAARVSGRLMVGANARVVIDDSPQDYSFTTDPGLDLGLLYRVSGRLSAGLLVQDVNRPTKKYAGVSFAPYARNWRPGIAYRPTDHSVIALDAYDLADEGGYKSFRVGGEIDLGDVVFRAGYYGFGGSGVPRAATFGVGTRTTNTSIDLAILAGDLDNTLIFSASQRLD
jgi:hypothetical protein